MSCNAIYLYMSQHLLIELGHDSLLTLRFQLLDNPITELWLKRMIHRNQGPLDHPDRFYGIGNPAEETYRAIYMVQQINNNKNSYENTKKRSVTF